MAKADGSTRSGSTALSYRNCVITPGWRLMWTGYRTCFHTLYDGKNSYHTLLYYIYVLSESLAGGIYILMICVAENNTYHYLKIISDVYLWTPFYGRAKAGRTARTCIQQLYADTGYSLDDQPEVMNDREGWRERVKEIRADGTT